MLLGNLKRLFWQSGTQFYIKSHIAANTVWLSYAQKFWKITAGFGDHYNIIGNPEILALVSAQCIVVWLSSNVYFSSSYDIWKILLN